MSRKWIILLVVGLSCITMAVTYLKGLWHRYPKGEVEVLEAVQLGGMEQWIMANGKSSDLPVLLWLHGGPGAAQMPVARYFNANLEDEFIVVHWDQRGAGKSNPGNFDERTMAVDQFILDTHELTSYLKSRFEKDKIFLLGHSWGTQIGLLAVARYPEDYYAYIGVGQISDMDESQRIAFQALKERLINGHHEKELRKLTALGEPPFHDHEKYVAFVNMLNRYGMNMDVGMGEFIRVALGSGIYGMGDFFKWLNGANRGSGPMWQESQGWRMIDRVSSVALPVYFISGENDYNTPVKTLKAFVEKLDVHDNKQMIVFQNASHMPFFADPERFLHEMKRIKDAVVPAKSQP